MRLAFLFLAPALGPKLFRMRTYEKLACNPFGIRTSKTQDLKSFRIRTYKKRGGGPVAMGGVSASLRSKKWLGRALARKSVARPAWLASIV